MPRIAKSDDIQVFMCRFRFLFDTFSHSVIIIYSKHFFYQNYFATIILFLVTPFEVKDVANYCKNYDCSWTDVWSCPIWERNPGSKGWAIRDPNNIGYYSCCISRKSKSQSCGQKFLRVGNIFKPDNCFNPKIYKCIYK